jgi:hypothetical protein
MQKAKGHGLPIGTLNPGEKYSSGRIFLKYLRRLKGSNGSEGLPASVIGENPSRRLRSSNANRPIP